jgi:hypothetical protein
MPASVKKTCTLKEVLPDVLSVATSASATRRKGLIQMAKKAKEFKIAKKAAKKDKKRDKKSKTDRSGAYLPGPAKTSSVEDLT